MKSEASASDWLGTLQRALKRRRAKRKLQRMVDERRQSFEVEDYRRRRAAALKGRAI